MADRNDPYEGFGWIIALVFSLMVILMAIVDEPFTIPWAAFRYVESYLWTSLPFMPDYIHDTHYELRKFLSQSDWKDLTWWNVFSVERTLSYTTTWIYIIPATKYFFLNLRKNRLKDRLKKRLDFEQMLHDQSQVYRYTRYLIKHNPLKYGTDLNKGIFAIRASVLHGLKKMRILWPDRENGTLIFDEARAVDVFSDQLRYLLPKDLNELNFLHKYYMCVFSLRLGDLPNVYDNREIKRAKAKLKLIKFAQGIINNFLFSLFPFRKHLKRKLSELRIFYAYGDFKNEITLNEDSFNETFRLNFLGDLSYHYNGELDLKYIERHVNHIFPQVLACKSFIELRSQHAYVESLLRRLLFEGRSIGKMPPNHFSFLKMVDRQLWYALNDEGLPGASIEAAGVYSHYELERRSGIKSYFPHVQQAIVSLSYPKTIDEFDRIKVIDDHPLSELFDYDPNEEYRAHIEKLKNDPDYRLKQTILGDANL
ncbi:hypothetical protein ACN1T8_001308 [Vibrio cholerae]|uniref:secretion/conjugation apparatus DotM-related subunit n=1 Tax=Vibrio cholerae TaxID=666 RepID=UPI001C92EE32|nr:hypothetical protein [Vibrio cholerae]EGR2119009.1 hypothetical protein [Vibrio cholerae]MBY4641954.1 hypothetical protein [Vibrio cholerae]MCR9658226.1 hypothetical protein [Vibrio cholerae]MCR9688907.1 hypothetical protein [Vibrio cholerae]MCR9737415.1 hypothetical protein [Vibrio cholerae]